MTPPLRPAAAPPGGRCLWTGGAGSAAAAGRLLAFVVAGLVASAAGGCAAPEPWVKPYERERLADPIMKFSRESLAERHREHVHSVREGARGATGVQGGGCGCN
jgi:hypothetical protein